MEFNNEPGAPDANQPDVKPSDVVAQITAQQGTPPPAPPATPPENGSQPDGGEGTGNGVDIYSQLVEATGGRIKSQDDLTALLGRADQFDTLQAEHQRLVAQSKLSPFANDLVKTANQFFQDGGNIEDYYRLIDLKRIDLDSMDPVSLVRMKFQFDHPDLSGEEINALIKKRIGNFDGEVKEEGGSPVVDPAVSAEMRVQAADAKKWIQEQREKIATPEAAVQRVNQEKQAAQMDADWTAVTNFALQDMKSIELKFDGIEGTLPFQIPDDFRKQLVESVKYFAMDAQRQGHLTLNAETYESQVKPQLEAWAQRIAYMHLGPDIVKSAVAHATAETEKRIRLELGGKPPVDPTNNGSPSEQSAYIKQIKEFYASPR